MGKKIEDNLEYELYINTYKKLKLEYYEQAMETLDEIFITKKEIIRSYDIINFYSSLNNNKNDCNYQLIITYNRYKLNYVISFESRIL